VTDPAGPAHGFLLEELTTVEGAASNPAIARATIDLAEHEPEPEVDDAFFPASLATVEPVADERGRRDMLSLMAGSFRDGRQRLNVEMGGRVMRSSSNDFAPPTIRRVDGLVADGGFSIRVDAEGADVLGGTVLYITDADRAAGGEVEWHRSDLSVIAPGVLSTGGTLPSGTSIPEAIIQVYDRSYNVATSNRKVEGHTFAPVPAGQPGDPSVVLDPPPPSSGFYSEPPSISLDPGDHDDAIFQVSVDGSEYRTESGPFTIGNPAEGEHLVTYRGSDGSVATTRFAVDTQGPTIVAEADRPANENGWYDGPVTFSFECGDAVSGVGSCPQPVALSESGRDQSFTVSARDRAGNGSQITVDDIDIDAGDPTITAARTTDPNADGWYSAPVTVRFDCADPLSGLTRCANANVSGSPAQASDEVTISSDGRDQTAVGLALDAAGNASSAISPPVSIDRTAPTAAITTPDGAILLGAQKVEGTASDALSGVKRVVVTYTGWLGRTVNTEATVTCGAGGSCTWAADNPGFGVWQASARSVDRAGNSSPQTSKRNITIR
jgi:hypothetical protein